MSHKNIFFPDALRDLQCIYGSSIEKRKTDLTLAGEFLFLNEEKIIEHYSS